MVEKKPTVAVTGATGYTAGFVIPYLLERGFTPIAIARNPEALANLPYDERVLRRHSVFDDAEALDRALEGAQAVIHLAGPFKEHSTLVVEAALRRKIHYVDVCAEQEPTKALFEQFDERAREAGVVVIPAIGQFGGLSDLIATAVMKGWHHADSVETYVGMDKWTPTQGSRNTINGVGNLEITNGVLTPKTQDEQKQWKFAEPLGEHLVTSVPFTDCILMHSHLKIGKHRQYLSQIAVDDVLDPSTSFPVAADELGRTDQNFIVEVVATRGTETRRAFVRGRDGYAATAPLVVSTVERLLNGSFTGAGVKAPGGAFEEDALEFLTQLDPRYAVYEALEQRELAVN